MAGSEACAAAAVLLLVLLLLSSPAQAQLALSRPDGDCLAPALTSLTPATNFFPSSYQLQSIQPPRPASSTGLETTVRCWPSCNCLAGRAPAAASFLLTCRSSHKVAVDWRVLISAWVDTDPVREHSLPPSLPPSQGHMPLAAISATPMAYMCFAFMQVEFASDFSVTYYGTYKVRTAYSSLTHPCCCSAFSLQSADTVSLTLQFITSSGMQFSGDRRPSVMLHLPQPAAAVLYHPPPS
jgi:hypothetical protein